MRRREVSVRRVVFFWAYHVGSAIGWLIYGDNHTQHKIRLESQLWPFYLPANNGIEWP